MIKPIIRYKQYRKERQHIREVLSPENENFW